jgi:signal transduction histidine kinase/CheY-like chemotaxis protein
MKTYQILLLEDSFLDAELIRSNLDDMDLKYQLTQVQTRADFLNLLQTETFDLILSDYSLPDFDGITALQIAQQICPETPFIFVSATLGEELAIEALKNGATDYVLKQRLNRLAPSVQRALRQAQEHQDLVAAQRERQEHHERLRLLFEMTSNLLSTKQPLSLLRNLFDKLSALMQLDCYFIFLLEESDGRRILRLQSWAGISEHVAGRFRIVEVGQCAFGWVARERCQIVINHVQQSHHPDVERIRELGMTAYAGQPLIAQGQLLGVLSFASKTRITFQPEEVAFLQAVSDQIAIALERAELLTSLQRQTEQLTQANRVKDEFLTILSHELRTPLNPILGWSKLLLKRRPDEETAVKALEIIERNARIQTQLIDDLLEVSRVLHGKLVLNCTPVDLVQTLEAALETTQLAARAKGIKLKITIGDRTWQQTDSSPENPSSTGSSIVPTPKRNPKFFVLGDAIRLQQVWWNLLSNAVKFTPQGGQVEIRVGSVYGLMPSDQPAASTSAVQEQAVNYVQVAVADTGIGIRHDFLPHVFDYFRQEDASTTRSFGGLGLGLAISRHVINAHGGTLQAESPGIGKGSVFTVNLPLLQEDYHRYTSHNDSSGRDFHGDFLSDPSR